MRSFAAGRAGPVQRRLVPAESVGKKTCHATDGGHADAGEVVYAAVGQALLQEGNHLPAVDEGLQLRHGVVVDGAVREVDALEPGGVLHGELLAALYGQPDAPPVVASFIGGLGGRDISPQEFFEIAAITRKAVEDGVTPPARLLYTREEYREIRKLQAIAHQERNELGSDA